MAQASSKHLHGLPCTIGVQQRFPVDGVLLDLPQQQLPMASSSPRSTHVPGETSTSRRVTPASAPRRRHDGSPLQLPSAWRPFIGVDARVLSLLTATASSSRRSPGHRSPRSPRLSLHLPGARQVLDEMLQQGSSSRTPLCPCS